MKLEFPSRLFQRKRRYFFYTGELVLLFAIYFVTAHFGLSLHAVSRFATLVWIPSGLAVATLLLFGNRLWPGILVGAFLVNFFNGASFFVAAGIGIGNTLEALVGTYLLKRNRFNPTLEHLRDVLLLVLLVMPASALVSATIGVSSLLLGRVIGYSFYFATWSAWWIGDMISILILTPFFLTWTTWPREKVSIKRMAEMGILMALVFAVGVLVFFGLLHPYQANYPLTYLVFPPLIWASLRFGPRGALFAILTFSILAIIGTIQGLSPFSAGGLSNGLLLLQSFMGIIAVTSLILAAVMTERKALERRKDEFISMASHELRTPLTSLLGYTELLQLRFARQDQQEAVRYLSRMTAQINRLSRLITDLLDISKIQVGKLAFTEEAFDVDMLVGEVVENLQQTTTRHQISVNGSVQRVIVGDRERLGQVLTNLITNAMKYSPNTENIIVHLTHDQTTLTISVQDFGIGIPRAHQEKVFERYYRVGSSRDRTYPGLGIGLYIAYQIVERHGGKMWVESSEGCGSTFSFSLPAQEKHSGSIEVLPSGDQIDAGNNQHTANNCHGC